MWLGISFCFQRSKNFPLSYRTTVCCIRCAISWERSQVNLGKKKELLNLRKNNNLWFPFSPYETVSTSPKYPTLLHSCRAKYFNTPFLCLCHSNHPNMLLPSSFLMTPSELPFPLRHAGSLSLCVPSFLFLPRSLFLIFPFLSSVIYSLSDVCLSVCRSVNMDDEFLWK